MKATWLVLIALVSALLIGVWVGSQTATLPASAEPSAPADVCRAQSVLSGTVRDYQGTPIAGATVQIVGSIAPSTQTDATGTYTIPIAGMPVSSYAVVAEPSSAGVISQTTDIGFWEGCVTGNLRLDFRERLLVGSTIDCSGHAVPNAKVEVLGWQTPPGDPHPNPAVSDANGAYTISVSSLISGTYTIVARGPNNLTVQQTADINCDACPAVQQVNFAGLYCLPDQLCPAPRHLTGVVRDYLGRPVAGATVRMLGWSAPPTTTNASGVYQIDITGLPMSTYSVIAQWPAGVALQTKGPDFWRDCLNDLPVGNLHLDFEEQLLTGSVYTCDGAPLAGAKVEIDGFRTAGDDPHPNPAVTDARGAYTITVSYPNVSGNVIASFLSTSVSQNLPPLVVPVTELNFSGVYCLSAFICPRDRFLSGIVRDSTGQPVPGASVRIVGWSAPPATTDSNGIYQIDISGLPVSSYTVIATLPNGEIIRETRDASFWKECSSANLAIDFQECILIGHAFACDGKPVKDAKVEVVGWQTPLGDPNPNPALTDATGAFTITISSLPPGTYTIVARGPNGLTVEQQVTVECPVTVVNFSGLYCLPDVVCPENRTVSGIVRNYLGQPVISATVQILGWPITATTSSTGFYAIDISGLPLSTYSVVARWSTGLAMQTEGPDFWRGCLNDLPFGQLHLDFEEHLLTGLVYDCDGLPLPGASVELAGLQSLSGDPHPSPAVTDRNGTYTITISYPSPPLPDTPYHIVASYQGQSVTQELAALVIPVTQLNFTGDYCVPGPVPGQCTFGATLSGEVWDCQGNPISGALVRIEGTNRTATTNALGAYLIDIAGLPIQAYTVRVTKTDFGDQVQALPLSFWQGCQNGNLALDFSGAFCLARLRVYVPVLNVVGRRAGYETWIEVQNIGACLATVTMELYGDYKADCDSSGALKTLHSGEIRPGSTWVWTSDSLPADARSAVLSGSQPIAVEVVRRGPGFPDSEVNVTDGYNGIPSQLLGAQDDLFGGYAYYAPIVYGLFDGLSSWLYIQNAGTRCTSVEIYFRSEDNCNRPLIGFVRNLPPGQMFRYDVTAAAGGRFRGSAWISASQPLATAVDTTGDNILMSYTAMPADTLYAYGGDTRASAGSQVNYGPLIYREYEGWDTIVHVQNLSSIYNAKVKVFFLDNSGDIIRTIIDWVCPRGTQSFFLPVINGLPGNYVGSVRVESQDWWSPGDPPVPYPSIVSVAELIKYEGPTRMERLEAMAYNLMTESMGFQWQGGPFGVKRLAIPSLIKGRGGLTSEIALQNLVPQPGFTDVDLFVYDTNRLLDVIHERLNQKQVEYINLDSWGLVPRNFEGSLVISATHWTHAVPGGGTTAGLAAVSVLRSNTVLGVDIPGDESAAIEAMPVPAVSPASCTPTTDIGIIALQCTGPDEYVGIRNVGAVAHELTNWSIFSVVGSQTYNFPPGFVLNPGASVRVHSGPSAFESKPADLLWTKDQIWEDDGDEAELYDDAGRLVDNKCCAAGCAAPGY